MASPQSKPVAEAATAAAAAAIVAAVAASKPPTAPAPALAPQRHSASPLALPKKKYVRNRRKDRKWSKPDTKPKRPLSAYNFYFQYERARIAAAEADTANASFVRLKNAAAAAAAATSISPRQNLQPYETRQPFTSSTANSEVTNAPTTAATTAAAAAAEATAAIAATAASLRNSSLPYHGARDKGEKPGTASAQKLNAINIANQWKMLDESHRAVFEEQSRLDKCRYQHEVAEWKKRQQQQQDSAGVGGIEIETSPTAASKTAAATNATTAAIHEFESMQNRPEYESIQKRPEQQQQQNHPGNHAAAQQQQLQSPSPPPTLYETSCFDSVEQPQTITTPLLQQLQALLASETADQDGAAATAITTAATTFDNSSNTGASSTLAETVAAITGTAALAGSSSSTTNIITELLLQEKSDQLKWAEYSQHRRQQTDQHLEHVLAILKIHAQEMAAFQKQLDEKDMTIQLHQERQERAEHELSVCSDQNQQHRHQLETLLRQILERDKKMADTKARLAQVESQYQQAKVHNEELTREIVRLLLGNNNSSSASAPMPAIPAAPADMPPEPTATAADAANVTAATTDTGNTNTARSVHPGTEMNVPIPANAAAAVTPQAKMREPPTPERNSDNAQLPLRQSLLAAIDEVEADSSNAPTGGKKRALDVTNDNHDASTREPDNSPKRPHLKDCQPRLQDGQILHPLANEYSFNDDDTAVDTGIPSLGDQDGLPLPRLSLTYGTAQPPEHLDNVMELYQTLLHEVSRCKALHKRASI